MKEERGSETAGGGRGRPGGVSGTAGGIQDPRGGGGGAQRTVQPAAETKLRPLPRMPVPKEGKYFIRATPRTSEGQTVGGTEKYSSQKGCPKLAECSHRRVE